MRQARAANLMFPAILAVVAVVAGYSVFDVLLESGSALDDPARVAAKDMSLISPAQDVALSLPAVESFGVIAERPLFSPDRRPPQPAPPETEAAVVVESPEPAVAPEPPPPPPISFTLVGIVLFGDQRVALLQPLDGGTAVQLREGEEYGGWTAALIDRERAVFRSAYAEEELKLDYRSPSSGSAPMQNGIPLPVPPATEAQ